MKSVTSGGCWVISLAVFDPRPGVEDLHSNAGMPKGVPLKGIWAEATWASSRTFALFLWQQETLAATLVCNLHFSWLCWYYASSWYYTQSLAVALLEVIVTQSLDKKCQVSCVTRYFIGIMSQPPVYACHKYSGITYYLWESYTIHSEPFFTFVPFFVIF